MDASDLTYDIVWQRVDETLTEELATFWLAQRALPSREAAHERARSVAIVARQGDGQIVGVSSVFENRYPKLLNNKLYGYRSFVAPEWRRGLVALELAKRVTEHLESEHLAGRGGDCIGIVMVMENPDLARGVSLAIDPRLPFVFIGTDDRGSHVRVYYFKGAEITHG